jgi:NADPH:quinone reductase-like Zn-dependent oxidoreductase
MNAVIASGYGAPGVLSVGEVPKPRPRDNEVLVKIYAGAVTQADVMMRKGGLIARLVIGFTKPRAQIPGTAFAGKVEAVGSNVTRFAVGDDVFGETTTGFRAHAQYVAVPEDGVIETVPLTMNYDEAAPVTDGALTVHNFLTNLVTINPGDKVLVNGAAGGLGTVAVQFAKHLGAEVTGVASGRNEDLVRQQGADHFVDYTREDFTAGTTRYDVIFDTVGKVSYGKAKRALKADGTYLSPVLGLGLLFQALWTSRFGRRRAKFSATGLLPHAQLREALGEVKALIEAGKIWTVIDRRYPLDAIAEAHAYVETGHKRGAVVLEVAHADVRMLAAA